MTKISCTLCLVIAVLASAFAGQASASLIQNGSFENPVVNGGYIRLTSAANPLYITGWTIESGSVDLVNTFAAAADGFQSIDLSGTEAGRISQAFATVVGVTYTVSFAMSGNFGDLAKSKSLDVGVDGGGSATFSYAFTDFVRPQSAADYDTHSWEFTASSASTTLYFQSLELYGYGAFLDNVSVSAATPVPGAAWLLGSGLIGLVGIRRRMKS